MIWEHYSGLRTPQSRSKMKNHRPKSNVRFVENQISRSLYPYMVFWEAKGSFKCVHAKNWRKKFVSVFRIKLMRILISADLVLQPGWVQTFFLRKYLILFHFLNLKTPIEDSILCHKRRNQFSFHLHVYFYGQHLRKLWAFYSIFR